MLDSPITNSALRIKSVSDSDTRMTVSHNLYSARFRPGNSNLNQKRLAQNYARLDMPQPAAASLKDFGAELSLRLTAQGQPATPPLPDHHQAIATPMLVATTAALIACRIIVVSSFHLTLNVRIVKNSRYRNAEQISGNAPPGNVESPDPSANPGSTRKMTPTGCPAAHTSLSLH